MPKSPNEETQEPTIDPVHRRVAEVSLTLLFTTFSMSRDQPPGMKVVEARKVANEFIDQFPKEIDYLLDDLSKRRMP